MMLHFPYQCAQDTHYELSDVNRVILSPHWKTLLLFLFW